MLDAAAQTLPACLDLAQACAALVPKSSGPPPWWAYATPFVTFALTAAAGYLAIRFDLLKAANQELIHKRIAVYDEMAPKLNDLLCALLVRGDWRNWSPPTPLAHKRVLDQARHVYGPLFSPAFGAAYDGYINAAFKTYTGRGEGAKLRGNVDKLRKQWRDDWVEDWKTAFVPVGEATGRDEFQAAYDALMAQFAREIGVRSHQKAMARHDSRSAI